MKLLCITLIVSALLGPLVCAETIPVKTETPGKYPPGTPGIAITVDEAFTTKHENTPPSVPFQVLVPKNRDMRSLPGGKKTGAPELLRLTLPDAEGKKAAEILRFGALNIPAGAPADQFPVAAKLLQEKAYPMFTNGFVNAHQLETYVTKVGPYDAVVLHIEMSEPDGGADFLVKAVAILNPGGPDGVLGFLMANKALSEVKTPEDLSSKGVGLQILHSVKFLAPAQP